MSEYWVSHKKYFCKYCNIYIADDKPSRTQHESGLKHKGNVERFVRGLYKAGEKKKQDLEEEKREMARVEKAAAAAYAQDVGAGLVKPGSSSTSVPKPEQAVPSRSTGRAADPYSNYSTAASLGYTDPDAERRNAEAEMRREQGVVGAWEVVAIEESASATAEDDAPDAAGSEHAAVADELPAPDPQSRKREAETPLDEDDARLFKFRRKKIGVGLGEIYDPGVIPIKLKPKEESAEVSLKKENGTSFVPSISTSQATALPKWSSRGWNKPGDAPQLDAQSDLTDTHPTTAGASEPQPVEEMGSETQQPAAVKTEVQDVQREPEVKQEEPELAAPASGGLFRKRKVPVGGGGRGRRP